MALRKTPLISGTFSRDIVRCEKKTMLSRSGNTRNQMHNFDCQMDWGNGVSTFVFHGITNVKMSEQIVEATNGSGKMICHYEDWGSRDYAREKEIRLVCRGEK